jgi:nucleotide-binding universal stress UspA family protein
VKRILVALDSSQRAPGVLAAASRLAELTDAKLIVFRAIGVPPEMPPELFKVTDLRLEDVLRNNAHTDLSRLVADVPPERIEKIVAELATPWDGICTAAREQDVDLVVIGSHGFGGLDRLLGTTAGKVVNHADRNVLVVRTPL